MSNTAQDQARAQVESIAAMVAALDVDYDRLEELREEREPLFEGFQDAEARHAAACRSYASATNAQNLLKDAQAALQEWDDLNGEELAELETAAGDCESQEDAETRIQEDPLSVEVRSDWCSPGEQMTAGEFRILLCTGGPHVEIVGDLDDYRQPSRVRVLFKDWGESGELFDFDRETVLRYCQQFFFGE